jgi:hypothetical protein
MDLWADVKGEMLNALVSLGYRVNQNATYEEVSKRFFNVRSRRIPVRKRKLEKPVGFTVPSDLQQGFNGFEAAVLQGDDINPWLNKDHHNPAYRDKMRFDWNICHFHLGATMERSGYISRTGPVLFAVVHDDAVYCVKIYQHGEWENIEALEIAYAAWPGLFRPHVIDAIAPTTVIRTKDDIKKMRDAHINLIYQLPDGTLLKPPGEGQAMDGTSVAVMMEHTQMVRTIRTLEKTLPGELGTDRLHVKWSDGKWVAYREAAPDDLVLLKGLPAPNM